MNTSARLAGLVAIPVACVLTACATGGAVNQPAASANPPGSTSSGPAASPTPAQPSASKTQRLTPSPVPSQNSPGVTRTAPPVARQNAILSDLAKRGLNPGLATNWDARYVTWPNGALGCPTPGQSYTQALVPGMQVLVTVAGRVYDYRFGRDDTPLLCTNPSVGPATPSTT